MKKSLKIPKGSETNRKTGEGQTIHWQKEKGQKDKKRHRKLKIGQHKPH
jgi:hypothetical protein